MPVGDQGVLPNALPLRRAAKAILAHPIVQELRRPLRNAWWWLKGRGASNPPVPSEVRSVLFVCLGNICRSPFGAELATRVLAAAGRADVRCTSAGIRPSQDNRSPDFACRASDAYGISLVAHRPQPLTPELMQSHDMIVVMELRHLDLLRTRYPERRERVFLLPLFDEGARDAFERYNISDPFGRPLDAFEECYRRMDRSLRRCLASVQR